MTLEAQRIAIAELRQELERVKEDRNKQGMIARTEAFKISEGFKTRAEQFEARVLEWENREASVCPEDTAFENVIGDLRAKLEIRTKELHAVIATAKRLRDYTSHKPSCDIYDFPAGTKPCSCGLQQAIAETEDAK